MNNLDAILPRIEAADPDRLRAARLGNPKQQEALAWIYGFHLELAKVPEIVSETIIGEIRYQWWRDAVNEIYTDAPVRAHEITLPLAKVLRTHDIPRFWVDRLIDGRSRDLDPEPFTGIEAARKYCRQTSGILMQIAAKCLTDTEDELILRAGEIWGLLGLARAYPYYHSSMLSNIDYQSLLEAITEMYRDLRRSKMPTEILPACAYAGLTPAYLKKMRATGFDPKTQAVVISPFSKQIRQFKVALFGRL